MSIQSRELYELNSQAKKQQKPANKNYNDDIIKELNKGSGGRQSPQKLSIQDIN